MTNPLSKEAHMLRMAKVRQGKTATEIGVEEGLTVGAIYMWAKRNKIALVKGVKGKKLSQAFQPLLDAGNTSREAAEALGCSLEVARYWARQTKQKWPVRRAAETSPRKNLLTGLTEAQKADAQVLMRKGKYTRREAVALVTKEKEKI